ncbi:MAG TPA: flagellar basal body rod protein FlgF [Pseudomonadales bacterium]|nr:flagellar basal body rod protein FlgF [Pseudomonadales bacterium]
MDKALYIAMTGAKHNMMAQAVNANNLANASTSGFKEDLAVARAINVPAASAHDSRSYAITQTPATDFSAGPLMQTGRDLDIAIDGDAWLAVLDEGGQEVYTRSASLIVDANGQLLTDKGQQVVGNGGPIAVPPYESILIGVDGSITVRGMGQGPEVLVTLDRLKLVTPEEGSLIKNANGDITLREGEVANVDAGARIVSGFVEGSNVDTIKAMVEMLSLARQYEAQVKVMQTVGESVDASSRLMQL